MIIIGERINTSRKAVAPAVAAKNEEFIWDEATKQVRSGACFLDVNCGTMVDNEPETLEWLVKTVQASTDGFPCAIDSPNPLALEKALKAHRGKAIINSITGEKERLDGILPLIREFKTGVVALTMDDHGMPETMEERFRIAARLIDELTKAGTALDDIYVDPLVRPVSTGTHYGRLVFETIARVKSEFPGVHVSCGLSNISFGLPVRKLINHTFLVMAVMAGLDAAILDPADQRLMSLIYAAELLTEKDDYALNYITAFREGKLENY